MPKIRLTKNELKKQKEALKRYTQYLPTLQLKKQQLQAEVNKIQHMIEEEKQKEEERMTKIDKWIAVFGEDAEVENILKVEEVVTATGNIAGVDIPVFSDVRFKTEEYDLLKTPLWVDRGIEALKEMIILRVKIHLLEQQLVLIREELRITTQRVNLFEKIKIPEAQESIRTIQIFLGDLQTAAVVTGKIAKEKIQKKAMSVEA